MLKSPMQILTKAQLVHGICQYLHLEEKIVTMFSWGESW